MGLSVPTHLPCEECAEAVFNRIQTWLTQPEYKGIIIYKPQSATVLDNSCVAYTIDITHGGDNLGVISVLQTEELTAVTWECYSKNELYPIELGQGCDILDRIMASKKAKDND